VKKCRDKGKGKQQKMRLSWNLTSCQCEAYGRAASALFEPNFPANDVKAVMKTASPKKSKRGKLLVYNSMWAKKKASVTRRGFCS
jgi:hypothetical protein